jgi:hypothetical protein
MKPGTQVAGLSFNKKQIKEKKKQITYGNQREGGIDGLGGYL